MGLQQALQITALVITIISFIGSIAAYLFKKIVTDPLQRSINLLNSTLSKIEDSTNRQLKIIDKEISHLKLSDTRQEEQIKTLFRRLETRK